MRTPVAVASACIASLALLTPGPSTSAAVSSDVVLLYRFNADTTVAITDSSAHALTGTLVNADPDAAFVTGAPGRKGGLQLIAAERQYVDVPESDVLDVDRYTVAAWVRYTGVTTPETRGRWEVLEKAGAYWLNVRTTGYVRAGGFYGGCNDSGYWKYLDSTMTVPTNTWTHVAATYNGAKLRIYIDGALSGALAVTGVTCSNDEPLAVGAKNAPAKGILEAFWDGRLDDVRIHSKALTAARIARLAS